MASEQWRLIEEKKQALLRRIEEKKRQSTDNNPPLPPSAPPSINTPSASQPPPPNPRLFVNDGSFMARFQAMQKSTPPSTTNTDNPSLNKAPVSLKITAVKKNTPSRPSLKTHDVFEKDEAPFQNGKHSKSNIHQSKYYQRSQKSMKINNWFKLID